MLRRSGVDPISKRFNSLRTGKRIQRENINEIPLFVVGFNSLRTGKRIQSDLRGANLRGANLVSIPFERESGYKVLDGAELDGADINNSFNSLRTGKRIQS